MPHKPGPDDPSELDLDLDDVQPLFVLLGDQQQSVRESALEALVTLPLKRKARDQLRSRLLESMEKNETFEIDFEVSRPHLLVEAASTEARRSELAVAIQKVISIQDLPEEQHKIEIRVEEPVDPQQARRASEVAELAITASLPATVQLINTRADLLAHLDPETSGRLIRSLLEKILSTPAATIQSHPEIGDAFVALVAALKQPPQLDVQHLFRSTQRLEPVCSPDFMSQLSWIAGQGKLSTVVRSMTPSLGSPEPQTKEAAVTFLSRVARHRSQQPMLIGPCPQESFRGGTFPEGIDDVQPEPIPAEEGADYTAYARLDCPTAVVAEEEFELRVGLSRIQQDRVSGGPITHRDPAKDPYDLVIHVEARGFALHEGESWRLTMRVDGEDPYPWRPLHLTPQRPETPIDSQLITATYSVDGQPIGFAYRSIAIARNKALLEDHEPPTEDLDVGIAVPADAPRIDLTVTIRPSSPELRLRWAITLDVAPDYPHSEDLGHSWDLDVEDSEDFAKKLIEFADTEKDNESFMLSLCGKGKTISDLLPDEFWNLLETIGKKKKEPPTILLLTAEPFIPWELAYVRSPLNPDAPPLLGAQAVVGRWVLARKRPRPQPPSTHSVASMAVIAGAYDHPDWSNLESALAEAERLGSSYGATPLDATRDQVVGVIQGEPAADVIHMAIHGHWDSDSIREGLVMTDGSFLTPDEVKGADLVGAPLVFLNACQVGTAESVLGCYAGMAEAFLYNGATAVVAPLWMIDDEIASKIAAQFYHQVLVEDASLAEALRAVRMQSAKAASGASTYLAYQLYGHPDLRLDYCASPSPRREPS